MKLRYVNTGLLILIIVINGYVIVAPLAPWLAYHAPQHTQQVHSLQKQIHQLSAPSAVPQENRLVIPAMLLDEQIFEGPTMSTLQKGPWRRPASSTPDHGGNTVIVGHRYTYTNPRGSFYFLDKLKIGDDMAVFWNHQKYLYRVVSVATVTPDTKRVEAPTTDSRLTLYTCTPLWLPKDRLVVVGQLEHAHE